MRSSSLLACLALLCTLLPLAFSASSSSQLTPDGIVPTAGAMPSYADVRGKPYVVDYDHRAIRINGQRVLLQSAGMHYPRSSPSMWPQLMADSAAAGLNTVQTYVFHNYHEEVQGHWDWATEHRNLSGFLQAAADAGLFVNLRIGPYVCAEWFYGGQPLWLHDQGFPFRQYNPGWTKYMADMMTTVVEYVEPYLARNGGPIIMTQIENEYGSFNEYVVWCGNLTRQLNTDTVWIMCQQPTPPAPIIPTCNGDDCSGYVQAQQGNGLPAMWTEDWVAWFQHWGEPVPTRDTRNIAYDVASFFAKGGTYQNYYSGMAGRTSDALRAAPTSSPPSASHPTSPHLPCPSTPPNSAPPSFPYPFILPSPCAVQYDYDGPLDEYGVPHDPKYTHQAQLHMTLNKYAPTLLANNYSIPQALGHGVELYSYGMNGSANSVVFLRNTAGASTTVKYGGVSFTLSGNSVQIIDGASMKVEYDSGDISGITPSTWTPLSTTKASKIQWTPEPIGISEPRMALHSGRPLEQVNATRYRTMYFWYSTMVTMTAGNSISIGLSNAGDHEHFFLNQTYLGRGDGAGNTIKTWKYNLDVQAGAYELNVLSITQGLENGAEVGLQRGLNGRVEVNGQDVTSGEWTQQVGLRGERMRYFNMSQLQWNTTKSMGTPMTWYQLDIVTPTPMGDAGWATWALDMGGMGKGSVWVNGFMLGAYWSIKDSKGEFSQQYYHVPRDNLKPPGQANNVVVLEESGGDPTTVALIQRNQRTKKGGLEAMLQVRAE